VDDRATLGKTEGDAAGVETGEANGDTDAETGAGGVSRFDVVGVVLEQAGSKVRDRNAAHIARAVGRRFGWRLNQTESCSPAAGCAWLRPLAPLSSCDRKRACGPDCAGLANFDRESDHVCVVCQGRELRVAISLVRLWRYLTRRVT
jgi:hypothetical protein